MQVKERTFADMPKRCFLENETEGMSLVDGKFDFKLLLNRDEFVFGENKRVFCWLTGCKSDILQFKISNNKNIGKQTKCKKSDNDNTGFEVYYAGVYMGSIRAYYNPKNRAIPNFSVIVFSEAQSINTYNCHDEECGWGYLGSFYIRATDVREDKEHIGHVIFDYTPKEKGAIDAEIINYPFNLYFGLYLRNQSLGIASICDCKFNGKRVSLNTTGNNVEYLFIEPEEYIMKYDADMFVRQSKAIQNRYPEATPQVRGLFVSAIGTCFSIIPRQLYYIDNIKRLNVTSSWLLGQLYFSIFLAGMAVDQFISSIKQHKEQKQSFHMMVIIRAFVYFMDNFTYVADNIKTGNVNKSSVLYFEHFGGDIIPISGQYDCEDAAWFLQTCFEHLKARNKETDDPLFRAVASVLEDYIPVSAIVQCKPPRIHFDFKMLGFKQNEIYYNNEEQQVGGTYYHMVCLLVPYNSFKGMINGNYVNNGERIYIADPCTMAYPDPFEDFSSSVGEETWERLQQFVQNSIQPAFIPTTMNRGKVEGYNGADQLYMDLYAFYTGGLIEKDGIQTTEFIIHKGDGGLGVPFGDLLYPEKRGNIKIDPNTDFYPAEVDIKKYEEEDRTLEPPYPLLDLNLDVLKREIDLLRKTIDGVDIWNAFFVKGDKEKIIYLSKQNSMYHTPFLGSINLTYQDLTYVPLLGWNLTNKTEHCSVIPSYLITYKP